MTDTTLDRRRDLTPSRVPHLSVAERAARGKAARGEVPRSSHGAWEAPDHRPDPIALLEEQATSRLQELVPIRYGRMLVSPFTFFRGAAYVMASDLASTPRSGLKTQLCGDAHLSNFGAFGTPERRLIFDINDFDETHPGPWEWDMKRLGASLEIAARDNGYTEKERDTIVRSMSAEYRTAMRQFASMGNLAVWYSSLDVEGTIEKFRAEADPKLIRNVERNVAKARTRDSLHAYERLTHDVNGSRRIISDPPLIVPIEEVLGGIELEHMEDQLQDLVQGYRKTLETDRRHLLEDYRFVHMARKVVGVGSVGTRAWIGLLFGRDDRDPLFLQMKEAQASVLESFLGRSEYRNHGQRVVAGQRLMQAASDIFLGWQRQKGIDGIDRDFYVRQLRDWKFSAEIAAMRPNAMRIYGQMCAWTLARAHARSGDRVAIASYLGQGGTFDTAMAEFARAYADQTERDHAALLDAVKSGRIQAEMGL
jgi:uncharacterized protein (DUF2252 family)